MVFFFGHFLEKYKCPFFKNTSLSFFWGFQKCQKKRKTEWLHFVVSGRKNEKVKKMKKNFGQKIGHFFGHFFGHLFCSKKKWAKKFSKKGSHHTWCQKKSKKCPIFWTFFLLTKKWANFFSEFLRKVVAPVMVSIWKIKCPNFLDIFFAQFRKLSKFYLAKIYINVQIPSI